MQTFVPHSFLQTSALVLAAAAISTIIFQKLRQPVILGYLIAGMVVGPHVPIPLLADSATVHTLSELGVILLMFSLGLEFSLRKLWAVLPSSGFIALFQCAFMIALGYGAGRTFGWSPIESFYGGALIAISSTTIILKAFAEKGVSGLLTEVVFGILIVEDLVAIVLLAFLTPLSAGINVSVPQLLGVLGKLSLLLGLIVLVGCVVVPPFFRILRNLNRSETTLVASIGFCFSVAFMVQELGYSIALGAFLAGSLITESGEQKTVESLIGPVRDMFGAIFFVSVGMLIDPAAIPENAIPILVFTVLVLAGKFVGVTFGALFAGYKTPLAVQTGMSLSQIGEFSFIIVGVGLSQGSVRESLYPIAVTVSAITTLTTPWMIQSAPTFAKFVESILPPSLRDFLSRRAQRFVDRSLP